MCTFSLEYSKTIIRVSCKILFEIIFLSNQTFSQIFFSLLFLEKHSIRCLLSMILGKLWLFSRILFHSFIIFQILGIVLFGYFVKLFVSGKLLRIFTGITKFNLKLIKNFSVFSSAVIGMVTLGNLMQKMVSGKLTPQSPVKEALYTNFHKVS